MVLLFVMIILKSFHQVSSYKNVKLATLAPLVVKWSPSVSYISAPLEEVTLCFTHKHTVSTEGGFRSPPVWNNGSY